MSRTYLAAGPACPGIEAPYKRRPDVTRIALRLVALVAPGALALLMGLTGCGDDHRSHGYRDRDQNVRERRDSDRHEDARDRERREEHREDDRR